MGFGKDNPIIVSLAKDLPASPATIIRRLALLSLPEKVQEMLEAHALQLQVGEEISRLRQLEDEKADFSKNHF